NFSLAAKDYAGNEPTPASLTSSFRIDRTPPSITLGTQDHILTNTKNFQFNVAIADYSPTTTTVVQNGVQILSEQAPAFPISAILAEGINVFEVNSVDAAGNVAATSGLFDIVLDTVPPTLSDLSPTSGQTLSSLGFTLSGKSSEPLSYARAGGSNLT